MPVLVMKFGGTSVATLDRIRRAAKRVGVEVAKGYDVIVIVSAMSGKTNELVGWVNETSPLYDAREYDAVVSSGENVTAGLMALTLQEMDVPARSWQGWQVREAQNSIVSIRHKHLFDEVLLSCSGCNTTLASSPLRGVIADRLRLRIPRVRQGHHNFLFGYQIFQGKIDLPIQYFSTPCIPVPLSDILEFLFDNFH